jgi:hypothetical protein
MANVEGRAESGSDAATKHRGSCHCGAVKFEVELGPDAGAARCNCSVCTKVAQTGAIVKPDAFSLSSGVEALSEYRWGGQISTRFFCRHCGIHCFGRGHLAQLGGDFVSVNLNALDDIDVSELKIIYWDGRHDNWQAGPRDTPWPIATPTPA